MSHPACIIIRFHTLLYLGLIIAASSLLPDDEVESIKREMLHAGIHQAYLKQNNRLKVAIRHADDSITINPLTFIQHDHHHHHDNNNNDMKDARLDWLKNVEYNYYEEEEEGYPLWREQ